MMEVEEGEEIGVGTCLGRAEQNGSSEEVELWADFWTVV
jgi:hypothetical protein